VTSLQRLNPPSERLSDEAVALSQITENIHVFLSVTGSDHGAGAHDLQYSPGWRRHATSVLASFRKPTASVFSAAPTALGRAGRNPTIELRDFTRADIDPFVGHQLARK
jgi:hypothetical protein